MEGTEVYRSDGDKVGTIERVMINKRSGQVAYAVMSFGGFLGIGEDYYPLPWSLPHLKTGWLRGERHRGPTPKYGTHETLGLLRYQERTIQTEIGPVEVARVKIRDRWAASAGERIRFTFAILPLVGAADEELGRAAACALPAGHHWRLLCSQLGTGRPSKRHLEVLTTPPGISEQHNKAHRRQWPPPVCLPMARVMQSIIRVVTVCNPAYIDHVHPRRSSPSRTAERPIPC